MKAGSRPQYYRIRRMVQMVREGAETGSLPNSSDFMREFEVSRRTVARDLDFLRDEERAPLAYDDARHGFRLTDETYTLPPVRISRKEAFSFGLARKLLAHYEGNWPPYGWTTRFSPKKPAPFPAPAPNWSSISITPMPPPAGPMRTPRFPIRSNAARYIPLSMASAVQ